MLHAIHEVKPTSPSREPQIQVGPSPPAAPRTQVTEHVTEHGTSNVPESTPREGQPVFERTLPSRTTKSRQVAITTLLVLANLVQVWHHSQPLSHDHAK
jgi:hypothetical protein